MYRNTWLEINLDRFKENCKYLMTHTNKRLIAVIKADGYGCGDALFARCALDVGASMVAVSSIDEAMCLVNANVDSEILILGYVDPSCIEKIKDKKIILTVVSLAWAKKLVEYDCKGLKVHLKVDTGMNRIGIKDKCELKEAYQLLTSAGVIVDGIFTHYACSDNLDDALTVEQFERFKEAYEYLGVSLNYVHANNSDASLRFKDELTNACRCGLAMLGYASYDSPLKPILSLYTTIVNTKIVHKGETISYGATYTCENDELIATLPIGYADGFIRRNQNRKVYVDGVYAPLVGRICMDQCMIKIPYDMNVGVKVEIFGEHISLEKMAKELDTITYEIICNLNERLTRKYIKDNKLYLEINKRLGN